MAVSAVGRGARFVAWEPIATAYELFPQFLITTASVYMVAKFGTAHDILPGWIAWPMAIGFEWTWLRGVATAGKVTRGGPAERWISLLTWTAMITVVCYGVLYILGLKSIGVIPEHIGPGWGVLLALAKVVPIALMGFASARLHSIYKQQQQAEKDATKEREREEQDEERRAARARLITLQEQQDAIEVERQRRQMELDMLKQATLVKRELRAAETPQPPSRAKPVTIDGVTYPSRAEAAKALGISPQAVSKRALRK